MVSQQPPTGTITFLFTDIEGSTRLWQAQPRTMEVALRHHDAILRRVIGEHGGHVFKTVGDAFYAAFRIAPDAIAAALEAQRALGAEQWPDEIGAIRVRMALHTGSADERDGDYFGPALNQVARLLAAGHGGQVLLSGVTAGLAHDYLPPEIILRDLGTHQLKDLAEPVAILQLVANGLPESFPPLRTSDTGRHHLPQQATSLIGRQRQVDEVIALLREPEIRLVTLTGVGGTGKTRLALKVAASVADEYEHGAHFVDLSAVTEVSGVPQAIITALGLTARGQGDPVEQLGAYFAQRDLLLVLDNFEQVIPAATVVASLIAGSPRLQVIVTSRELLLISGEHEYSVPPLSLPASLHGLSPDELLQVEAIALFVDRARAVRHEFQLDDANAPAIVQICRRLDGLPLAIELAAARVRLFPPQALLARLEARLNALGGGMRDLPERQQTLRGAIDWSYDLLDENERQLFWRLAVFSGGWDIAAAEEVCGPGLAVDVLDGLESLLNKSLLRRTDSVTQEPRFTMLETISEYARERLAASGEEETLRRRHAAYFAALARQGGNQLRGHDQLVWLDRLHQETDNLRAAINFSLDGADVTQGVAMAADLRDYWLFSSKHAEAEEMLRRAQGFLPLVPQPVQADALSALGIVLVHRQKIDEAVSILEQTKKLAEELGDRRRYAWALMWGLAGFVHEGKATELAEAQTAVAILREEGDAAGVTQGLNIAGEIMRLSGDFDEAEAAYRELIPIAESSGDFRRVIMQYSNLATIGYERRDAEAMIDNIRQGYHLTQQRYRVDEVASFMLTHVAVLASWHHHDETAAMLIGAALGWYESNLMSPQPTDADAEARMRNEVRNSMDDDLYATALERGRSLSLPEAIALAEEELATVKAMLVAASGR